MEPSRELEDEAWASRMSVGLIGRKKLRKLFKLRMDYMNNGPEIGKKAIQCGNL